MSTSWISSQTTVSSSASHAPSNRYCGSVPAVARSPSGVGWNVHRPDVRVGRGLQVDVDRAVPVSGQVPVARVQALDDRAVRRVRRRLGREARLVPPKPRSTTISARQVLRRRPVGRHLPGQPEPGRAPRSAPGLARRHTARTSRRTRCRSRPAPPARPTTPRSTAAAAGRPPAASRSVTNRAARRSTRATSSCTSDPQLVLSVRVRGYPAGHGPWLDPCATPARR